MHIEPNGYGAQITDDDGSTVVISHSDLGKLALWARRRLHQQASENPAGLVPIPTLAAKGVRVVPDAHRHNAVIQVVAEDDTVDGYVLPLTTAKLVLEDLAKVIQAIESAQSGRTVQ